MEIAKSVEHAGLEKEEEDKVSENRLKHNELAYISLNLFDEDMILIGKYKIYGDNPVNCIELENVHFLTVDFYTKSELTNEFTENELEKCTSDMSGYIGIGLRFYTLYPTKHSHLSTYTLKRTAYAGVSKKNPISVYKYDRIKYHLLSRFSILNMNIGRESEDEMVWLGDNTDTESLSSLSTIDDSEYMSQSSEEEETIDFDDSDDDVEGVEERG